MDGRQTFVTGAVIIAGAVIISDQTITVTLKESHKSKALDNFYAKFNMKKYVNPVYARTYADSAYNSYRN